MYNKLNELFSKLKRELGEFSHHKVSDFDSWKDIIYVH